MHVQIPIRPAPPPPPTPYGEPPDALVGRGLGLHRAGRLAEAEPLYRAALEAEPRHFGALHLLGLLRAMAGDPAGAEPLLRAAIARDPGRAFVHNNLGNALVELGRAAEALEAFDRAVALDPALLEARVGRGNALHALGRMEEALGAHDAARAAGAAMPELHNNRGNALRALGRPAEALEAYEEAIRRNPVYAAAHANRATALSDLDREADALASVGIALLLKPEDPGYLAIQAVALRHLARPAEALDSLDRALLRDPARADVLAVRVAVLCDLGRHEEALACAEQVLALREGPAGLSGAHRRRAATLALLGRHAEAEAADHAAIAADPDHAEAWNGRGNALGELGRFEEALACFARAGALHPGSRAVPYNRGNALRGLGRHREAIACYEEALAIDQAYADAEWNAALSRLALGDFARGLAGYEARWRRKAHPVNRHAGAPLWRGAAMPGGTLLLHAEQGLGDTMQMARYAPLAAAASGARLVLMVQPALRPLLEGLPGIDALLPLDAPAPPHDAQCPLMSLPLALGTAPDTVPPVLPFAADPGKAAEWRAGLPAGGIRLGLVCSGNPMHGGDRHRSVPLALFAPLLGPGVSAFLVQTDLRAADEAFLSEAEGIADLRPRLTGFAETAAALAAMDAVVCVDTSVAHLAGTLGRPTHLLLPPLADWRWMLDRTDTPWYPSVRLHRRARAEGWEDVIARVAAALSAAPPAPC